MMNRKRFFWAITLLAGLAVFSGCAGKVRYASTQNGFYSLGSPRIQIDVAPPLEFKGNGKLWADIPSDDSMLSPQGSFAWSVYAEGDSGPLARTAHIILSDLNHGGWTFEKETWGTSNHLLLSKETAHGYFWTTHVLYVPAEKDWFSVLWQENGREVPAVWVAKRWSTTVIGDSTRLVLEYREPAPQALLNALESGLTDKAMLWMSCAVELDGFSKRADSVFKITSSAREMVIAPGVSRPMVTPPFRPDLASLVGKSQANWGGDGPFLDD